MMASEGSVSSGSSRIRQFGLYRSIDARTEEFLRLSRRRQIRQGCACAAVSTAITVTVVVVVIFVYEFSLNSEVNTESSLRRNWFSLINDTTENGFKTKYAKAGIDKTTLTLLPILLKALKKNVFLEKILEEQSNSSPSYEAKQTTEPSYGQNLLTRNWFRVPQSKLYAIAYKTSPIAYYRSPTQNMEYFTKIRKIRDYQRIIKYVDKMISEKVYIGSTKPMMKEETFTEKPLIKIVPKTKPKPAYKSAPSKTQVPKSADAKWNAKMEEKMINCKCPKKLGEVLKKILSGIQKLLSTDGDEIKAMTDCHKKNNLQQQSLLLDTKLFDLQTNETVQTIVDSDQKLNEDIDKNTQLKTSNPKGDKTKTTQGFWQQEFQYINDLKNNERTTFNPINHLDATDDVPQFLTKPMTNVNHYKDALEQKSLQNFIQKINEMTHRNNKNNFKQHNKILGINLSDLQPNENVEASVGNDMKINDDFDKDTQLKTSFPEEEKTKTTQDLWQQETQHVKDFKNYQRSTFPEILTKSITNYKNELESKSAVNISQRNNEKMNEKPEINFSKEFKQDEYKTLNHTNRQISKDNLENLNISEFHKNEEEVYLEQINFDPLKHVSLYKPITFKRLQSDKVNELAKNKLLMNLNKAIYQLVVKDKNIKIKPKPTQGTTPLFIKGSTTTQATSVTVPNNVFTKSINKNSEDKMIETNNIILSAVDEDTENLNNFTEEDFDKQSESVTNLPVHSDVPFDKKKLNNENALTRKSMMPSLRPVYLEIHQKNDWKHEDQEYDFNILTNYDNILDIA